MNGSLAYIDPGAEMFWRTLFEYGPWALIAVALWLAYYIGTLRGRQF